MPAVALFVKFSYFREVKKVRSSKSHDSGYEYVFMKGFVLLNSKLGKMGVEGPNWLETCLLDPRKLTRLGNRLLWERNLLWVPK